MIKLYGINNCDKVKKAKKFLDSNKCDYEFFDFKKGVDKATISGWCKNSNYENFLNRRSTTWRNLPVEEKSDIGLEKAIDLMCKNPTLIKRPVIIQDNNIFFSELSINL